MTSSKLSTRFVIFVVASLITHLLELAANGWFCHTLIQQADLRMPWFSVAAGLLIIPMVAVQLASAVLILRRKPETYTTCQVVTTAILHVLQLGFISRHFNILKEAPLSSKKTEVIEMMLLRISFAVLSGSTLLVMQIYLLFNGSHDQSRPIYVSGAITLISVTWAVSTFRRCLAQPDFGDLLIAWPGTILRICWRAGEILARIIAIGLFASLYARFLILVIGLHWLSVLVCLYIPLITSIEWPTTSCTRRTFICLMISFTHVFVFINTSSDNVVFRYTFYYVIFFLENATLIAVWFIQSSSEQFSQNSVFAYIGVISFVAALTAMITYYKFFHAATFKATTTGTCENPTCNIHETSNCHSAFYRHEATENGHSQTVSNSLLDSDLNSTVSASSSRIQHEDHVKEHDAHHKPEARNNGPHVCPLPLNTSSSIEGAHKKGSNKNNECPVSELKNSSDQTAQPKSNKRPVWLPSGDSNFANQLLKYNLENLGTGETVDSEPSSDATDYDDFCNSCSSTRNTVLPSVEFHETAIPVDGCHEHNSIPNDRKNKTRMTSLATTICANACDPEKGYKHCCECTYGVSDLPTLEHSVKILSESDQISEGKIAHCPHTDSHLVNIHHHQHDKCIYNSTNFFPTKMGLLKKHSQDDLESVDETSCSNRDNRKNITSSLVVYPSIDRRKKLRYSPTQKVQNVTFMDNFTSISPSANEHGINLSRNQIYSTDREQVLAQSDKLASQLLKASSQTEKNVSHGKKPDIAIFSTLDPRFTLRVMTSPVQENSTCVDLAMSQTKTENSNERMAKFQIIASRKSKETDHSESKYNPNIYSINDNAITDPSKDISLSGPVGRTNNDISSSGLEINPAEVVYENLWPAKQELQQKRMKDGVTSRFASDTLSGRSDRRGIYACSESEDSALPQEVLSSSAEGFTASDSDSDVSLEFVI